MSATAAVNQAEWATATVNMELLAPAFLGDAQQQAEWRTPPLKALLRQWWRVAWWPRTGDDITRLRGAEAERFGAVQGSAHVSSVRMRLEGGSAGVRWAHGQGPLVAHPELGRQDRKTGAWLYLGYGPVQTARQRMVLEAGAGPVWRLAFPPKYQAELRAALQLAHWFGAVGSRSRNAWGSIALLGEGIRAWDAAAVAAELDHLKVTLPLSGCLRQNWPAAIGADSKGPLVWQSEGSFHDWKEAMKVLAERKVALRVSFPFSPGRQDGALTERHLLGLPVTNHKFSGQGNSTRWAAQLRFKLVRDAQGQLLLVAVHLPAQLDAQRLGVPGGGGLWDAPAQQNVWTEVHSLLDRDAAWRRIGGKR